MVSPIDHRDVHKGNLREARRQATELRERAEHAPTACAQSMLRRALALEQAATQVAGQ